MAVTYLAVAWFFIEVAGTTFPMLGLPDAAGRWLIGLLVVGFPVALVLGWAFDVGPEGIERTPPTGSADSVPERPSRAWALVAAGAALGAGLVWAVPRFAAGPAAPLGDDAPSANVIAVLPFEVRGSEQLAYLGEGIVAVRSVTGFVTGGRVSAMPVSVRHGSTANPSSPLRARSNVAVSSHPAARFVSPIR